MPSSYSWVVTPPPAPPAPGLPPSLPVPAPVYSIGYVSDWRSRLRSRLYEQFRDKPNLVAVCDAFAAEAQELEDALQSLTTLAAIDTSTGAQLQVLGRLIGQRYSGENDALYRLRLRARIAVNRSSGDPEDLYRVFAAVFGLGDTGEAQIVPFPPAPAAFVFRVLRLVLDGSTAALLLELLRSARVGGSRLVLESSPVATEASLATVDVSTPAAGPALTDASSPLVGGALTSALSS